MLRLKRQQKTRTLRRVKKMGNAKPQRHQNVVRTRRMPPLQQPNPPNPLPRQLRIRRFVLLMKTIQVQQVRNTNAFELKNVLPNALIKNRKLPFHLRQKRRYRLLKRRLKMAQRHKQRRQRIIQPPTIGFMKQKLYASLVKQIYCVNQ